MCCTIGNFRETAALIRTLCYDALNRCGVVFGARRADWAASIAVLKRLVPHDLATGGANHGSPGEPDMLDRSLEAEFESYRKTLSTDEARRAFDELIERLLGQHGVDYVRGYVDALKAASS